MSVVVPSMEISSGRRADLRLAAIGGATVFFSISAFAAGYFGALPSGLSTAIVLFGMGVSLKLIWAYVARSASSANRTHIATLISNVGLALSAIAALAALPRLTKTSGVTLLIIDLLAHLWTLALLSAAAAPVRTLGWRAFLGAFLFGFLGLTGLARFLGRPLILALGPSSLFATAMWVPLTEELCKMLPVILILVLALRRREVRPSLLDLILVGAWAAAGFAVFENATYGRGGFSLTASPILSMIFPATLKGTAFGWSVSQTGHMVHTALIALGVGFAFLYRRRVHRAWIIAAAAIAVTLIEHCSQNAIITGGINRILADTLLLITVNGRLSSILLVAGIVYVANIEWRAIAGGFRPAEWLRLPAAELQRRGTRLAALQTQETQGTTRVHENAP